MEKRLAEFRARRNLEKQATKTENQPESSETGRSETHTAPNDATQNTESNMDVKEASISLTYISKLSNKV